MARVTAWLAGLSFAAGCIALLFGVRVGHGSGELSKHLLWGLIALFLQLFTASTAAVHARASEREIAALRASLEAAAPGDGSTPGG